MASIEYQKQLNRLQAEQNKAINDTKSQLDKWLSFKTDYDALRERLRTLPDSVTHDVMVPIGKMAFMPGQLVHTNEIMVLLGDNWFVERSAKQAADIVTRRIESIDKQIDELNKQLGLLQPRLDFTSELEGMTREGGVQDIREEYNEEKEKVWKAQHKKNVQAYRQKLKTETEQSTTPVNPKDHTDEELWKRLEQLEEFESRRHELAKIGTNAESKLETQTFPAWVPPSSHHSVEQPDAYQQQSDGSWERLQRQNEDVPQIQQSSNDQTDSDSEVLDSDDDEFDEESEVDDSSDSDDHEESLSTGKGQLITFSHTPHHPEPAKDISSSEEQLTPGNIFQRIYKPKSILKKSPQQKRRTKKKTPNHSKVSFDTGSDEGSLHSLSAMSVIPSTSIPAFTSAVHERQTTDCFTLTPAVPQLRTTKTGNPSNANSDPIKTVTEKLTSVCVSAPMPQSNTKPVSRFKAQRLNKS